MAPLDMRLDPTRDLYIVKSAHAVKDIDREDPATYRMILEHTMIVTGVIKQLIGTRGVTTLFLDGQTQVGADTINKVAGLYEGDDQEWVLNGSGALVRGTQIWSDMLKVCKKGYGKAALVKATEDPELVAGYDGRTLSSTIEHAVMEGLTRGYVTNAQYAELMHRMVPPDYTHDIAWRRQLVEERKADRSLTREQIAQYNRAIDIVKGYGLANRLITAEQGAFIDDVWRENLRAWDGRLWSNVVYGIWMIVRDLGVYKNVRDQGARASALFMGSAHELHPFYREGCGFKVTEVSFADNLEPTYKHMNNDGVHHSFRQLVERETLQVVRSRKKMHGIE